MSIFLIDRNSIFSIAKSICVVYSVLYQVLLPLCCCIGAQDCPFCLKIHARKQKGREVWKEEGVKTDRKERARGERGGKVTTTMFLSRSFVLYG